ITVDPKTVMMVKKAEMTAAPGANIGGKWIWTGDANGQQVDLAVDLKQEGGAFTGSSVSAIGNAIIEGGKVSGKAITAKLMADVQGQPMEFLIEATVDGDKISGTVTGGAFGALPFVGVRAK